MPYEISFKHRFEVADRDQYINDCCFAGDIVSDALIPSVTAAYDRVQAAQEDWGWFIWFRLGNLHFAIDIACDDLETNSFKLLVAAFTPHWMRSARNVEGPPLDAVRDLVLECLKQLLPTATPVHVAAVETSSDPPRARAQMLWAIVLVGVSLVLGIGTRHCLRARHHPVPGTTARSDGIVYAATPSITSSEQSAGRYQGEPMQTFPPIHEISDKAMLHEYLGERQAAKDFRTMIAIIERLSELEHRTSVRANYAHVIGVIYRDELRELEPAKRSFERVLALDPSHPNATRALAKLKLSD